MVSKRLMVFMCLLLSFAVIFSACSSPNQSSPSQSSSSQAKVESKAPEASKTSGDKVVKFKFVANKQDALMEEVLTGMAKSIEEKSGGTLIPEKYIQGQLGTNDEDLCTGLAEKNYEFLLNSEWFQIWHSPEWMDLLNLAFIFRDPEHLQKFWLSDIGKMLNDKTKEKFGVRTYSNKVALRGARYLTANKPVKHVDDMKGLKMRTPNIAGVIASWKATGANVTPVPWGELYGALQTGVVDSQENPAANIDSAGMYQVQKYVMKTGHQYNCFFAHMNDKWYNSLSEKQKKAIDDSIDEWFGVYNKRVKENEEILLKKFTEKGMTIIETKDIDIESFKKQVIPTVLKQFEGKWVKDGWDKIQAIK